MNKKDKIKQELKKQYSIEKNNNYYELLKMLEICRTMDEWKLLTKCRFYRYGTLSYETYRFYDMSEFYYKIISLTH